MKTSLALVSLLSLPGTATSQQQGDRIRSFRALQIEVPDGVNATTDLQIDPSPPPNVMADDAITPTPLEDGQFERDEPSMTTSPMPSTTPMPTMVGTPVPELGTNSSATDADDDDLPMNGTTTTMCGCASCDMAVWDTLTDETTTCGDRITFVMTEGSEETDACELVAEEFPDECGDCNPTTCVAAVDSDTDAVNDENATLAPTMDPSMDMGDENMTDYFCECEACNMDVLDTMTEGNATCGDRLGFLLDEGTNETDACLVISDQFPDECGMCNPFNCSVMIVGGDQGNMTMGNASETMSPSPTLAEGSSGPTVTAAPSLIGGTMEPTVGFANRSTDPISDTSAAAAVVKWSMLFASGMAMLLGLMV